MGVHIIFDLLGVAPVLVATVGKENEILRRSLVLFIITPSICRRDQVDTKDGRIVAARLFRFKGSGVFMRHGSSCGRFGLIVIAIILFV